MVTVDEQLMTLKGNQGSLTNCGTSKYNDGLSIDRWTILVNHHLVQRRCQYLISEYSKYGHSEEHQWPVGGSTDRVVGP